MKKKIMGVILAAMMVSMMGMSALAAPSKRIDSVVTETEKAVDKNGNAVEVKISDVPEASKAAADEIKNVAKVKEVLKDSFVEGMEVVDVREVTVTGDNVEFPLTITFKVPGVLETTKVAVLHYVDGAWKQETAKAGQGTITATFDSLSPVAFVVDKNTAASSSTSPKTGESMAVTMAAVVVVVAAAGAFAFRKKESVR